MFRARQLNERFRSPCPPRFLPHFSRICDWLLYTFFASLFFLSWISFSLVGNTTRTCSTCVKKSPPPELEMRIKIYQQDTASQLDRENGWVWCKELPSPFLGGWKMKIVREKLERIRFIVCVRSKGLVSFELETGWSYCGPAVAVASSRGGHALLISISSTYCYLYLLSLLLLRCLSCNLVGWKGAGRKSFSTRCLLSSSWSKIKKERKENRRK